VALIVGNKTQGGVLTRPPIETHSAENWKLKPYTPEVRERKKIRRDYFLGLLIMR